MSGSFIISSLWVAATASTSTHYWSNLHNTSRASCFTTLFIQNKTFTIFICFFIFFRVPLSLHQWKLREESVVTALTAREFMIVRDSGVDNHEAWFSHNAAILVEGTRGKTN